MRSYLCVARCQISDYGMRIRGCIYPLKPRERLFVRIVKQNIDLLMSGKILIVGPSWVGDMMMAQTLFLLLHQSHKNLQLDVLAPAWSLPLLSRMTEVHQAIISPFQHGELSLRARYQLGKSLRKTRYDQAIILPNSLTSALIPWMAKM